MKNDLKECLEKIIEMQAKVIELQDELIKTARHQANTLQLFPMPPLVNLAPSVQSLPSGCSAGGFCEYPDNWGGTTPPPCKKCFKSSGFATTVIVSKVGLSG